MHKTNDTITSIMSLYTQRSGEQMILDKFECVFFYQKKRLISPISKTIQINPILYKQDSGDYIILQFYTFSTFPFKHFNFIRSHLNVYFVNQLFALCSFIGQRFFRFSSKKNVSMNIFCEIKKCSLFYERFFPSTTTEKLKNVSSA